MAGESSTSNAAWIGNGAFATDRPQQLLWDSVSIGAFKTCPRKYQLSIIEGWQQTSAEALDFGIAYHAAHEEFAKAFALNPDPEAALHAAVLLAFRISAAPSWQSHTNRRNRYALLRAIVWYYETYPVTTDSLHTLILADNKPAVELSFKFPITDRYVYSGHLDRLVVFQDQVWVLDYKSTGSSMTSHFFSQFRPDTQMSGYSLAGQIAFSQPTAGVIIDGCQLLVGSAAFSRSFSPRTEDELDLWLSDLTEWWLPLAEACANNGHWPMNDKACSMYGGCQFRSICAMPRKMQPAFLASNFTRKVWDPSIPR